MNYNWNWRIFFEPSPEGTGTYADMLLSGLSWTIATALCSWIIAFSLGSFIGVLRTLPSRGAQRVGTSYVELFRNIPLLVQMFLWFYVVPELLPGSWGTWLKQLPNASFYTAVVCLGFFTASRVAEQVRTGIETLPRGQRMAGTALGLTTWQTYRYVLLPNAYRVILPPLTSEFLNNLKNTSVALTIGLLELTARARSMQEFSSQVFESFTAATVIYLGISLIVVTLSSRLETRITVPGSR
ncbi:amino acid ABC transporter permease [Methylobacterium sp. 77]|uniref:amino acid ABC transporter permease n=1 Tax=Methylobacterium sp. 77 TaxID=1101192 RepID=UPI00036799FD|nr:amino acid ABC transporter permease [Methylobacterium sp. 77]